MSTLMIGAEKTLREQFAPALEFLNEYVAGGHFTVSQLRDIEAYIGVPFVDSALAGTHVPLSSKTTFGISGAFDLSQ